MAFMRLQQFSASRYSTQNRSTPLETMLVQDTLSAIAAISAYMRWESPRPTTPSHRCKILRYISIRKQQLSWLQSSLLFEIARRYIGSSLRAVCHSAMVELSERGRGALERYVRDSFVAGRSVAWPSQIAGIRKLAEASNFALCTPTGSGKTTVRRSFYHSGVVWCGRPFDRPRLRSTRPLHCTVSRASGRGRTQAKPSISRFQLLSYNRC